MPLHPCANHPLTGPPRLRLQRVETATPQLVIGIHGRLLHLAVLCKTGWSDSALQRHVYPLIVVPSTTHHWHAAWRKAAPARRPTAPAACPTWQQARAAHHPPRTMSHSSLYNVFQPSTRQTQNPARPNPNRLTALHRRCTSHHRSWFAIPALRFAAPTCLLRQLALETVDCPPP